MAIVLLIHLPTVDVACKVCHPNSQIRCLLCCTYRDAAVQHIAGLQEGYVCTEMCHRQAELCCFSSQR